MYAHEMARLAHTHETGAGLSTDQLRKGTRVEKEHTRDQATARQIAIDHLHEMPDYYTQLAKMEKAAKAYKLQGRMNFRGLEISIENKKGSRRYWYDPHGKEKGSTLMHADYGYIRGTEGTDGDHVDVYVGTDVDAPSVYIINQVKKPEGSSKGDGKTWSGFDEQKCMLGFGSAEKAKELYLRQYDDPRFFGSMKEMPFDEFRQKVLSKDFHGEKISNGDMLQYFLDHPEKERERPERKKEASVSKAETRRAALVAEQRMMGRGPAIMGSYPTKEANLDPVTEQRAKHIDDLGLAVLGAPAALSLAQHGLDHVGGRTGAVARGAAALANRLRPVSNVLSHGGPLGYATELGGLALVSPTVSEAIAKKIPTKLAPTPELSDDAKLAGASDLLKDPSKLVSALSARRVAQGAAPVSQGGAGLIARQLQRPGANVREIVRAHASAVPLKGLAKTSDMRSDALNASAHLLLDGLTTAGKRVPNLAARGVTQGAVARGAARRGVSALDSAIARSAAEAKTLPAMAAQAPRPGFTAAGLPGGGTANWQRATPAAGNPPTSAVLGTYKPNMPAQAPGGPIRQHAHPSAPASGPPTIVPPGASQGAPAGAVPSKGVGTATPRKSMITPGHLLGAGAVGVGGLGLYGGYRAIDTVANMVDPAYQHAAAGPDPVYGPGRVY